MLPKVAIFLSILLLSSTITNSYAFSINGLESVNNSQNHFFPNSDIMSIEPNFLVENNFKRYLIFGTNLEQNSILKNNSLYGVASDHGFFSVSLLSEQTASNLITKGYTVIEDSKLDFHSSNKISPDVSRIGEIT